MSRKERAERIRHTSPPKGLPGRAYLPFLALGGAAVIMLFEVFFYRVGYPLDLEWMEGGTLVHALRVLQGEPLYAPPSVDFVSFLYTPGYPLLLAGLSEVFGLSYLLGRLVSVVSFALALAIALAAVHDIERVWGGDPKAPLGRSRTRGWSAGALACGAICLAYPFCGQWFDLVRADSLWLALVASGLYLARPKTPEDHPGKGRRFSRRWYHTVAAAALMTAAFFTKQTAAPFIVAAAVAMALTAPWRHALLFSTLTFTSCAGLTLIAQHMTGGWFWIYIYKLHQSHELMWNLIWPDTPMKIFSHGFLIWGLGAAWLVAAGSRRSLSHPLFFWFVMAGCGLATSAVGSATQGAYKNALIPAVYFSAIWAGGAVLEIPRLLSTTRGPAPLAEASPLRWVISNLSPGPSRSNRTVAVGRSSPGWLVPIVSIGCFGLLGAHLIIRWFDPTPLVPSVGQERRARRHISLLRMLGPDVFVPYHPYENVIAGGDGHLHVMGINDIHTWAETITGNPARDRKIRAAFRASIRRSFVKRRWTAVIHDRTYTHQLFGMRRSYRLKKDLADSGMAPSMQTGNPCSPRYLWVPRR